MRTLMKIPEIRVTVKDEGPIGKTLKDAMFSKGKPVVEEKVRVYVESMAKGGPAKEELESKKVEKRGKPVVGVSVKNEGTVAPVAEKKEVKKEGFKSISLTEKFSCRAKDLFEILMDENRWKGFTQMTGRNVELQEGKLIVQQWRFGNWPDGIVSNVRITFDEPEPGVTIVKVIHTDIPEEDRYGNATVVENTERGWRDLILNKIRAVFGFGI
ncbi:ACTIVATOR OF 90 KDA HEAT SHOCK ATPASE-LIKE PROTEIN [Salix koriyanagi]|uniref:ACTIVATOR OF 90 kDa HEAT SHOCK ATPASE-LIKE PROTEIN n=1 Tax=Salix koriyanagi TaxID=2511006 RepID=A0A9Q1APA1_9ROSI|nr:ACTIVATOR OF 90 KDA HEAT SHOCK ATPASE-LIKE PROTEIN [Salix koriyanagi]